MALTFPFTSSASSPHCAISTSLPLWFFYLLPYYLFLFYPHCPIPLASHSSPMSTTAVSTHNSSPNLKKKLSMSFVSNFAVPSPSLPKHPHPHSIRSSSPHSSFLCPDTTKRQQSKRTQIHTHFSKHFTPHHPFEVLGCKTQVPFLRSLLKTAVCFSRLAEELPLGLPVSSVCIARAASPCSLPD